MRLSFSFFKRVLVYTKKNKRDWPLWLRLFYMLFPVMACFIVISAVTIYYNLSKIYETSLNTTTLIEAKILSERLEQTFIKLRDNLFIISQTKDITAEQLRQRLIPIFQQNSKFIAEIGFRKNNGETFMLLRDEHEFREIQASDIPQSPYSAFQQIAALPLIHNEVALLPAVQVYYPSTPSRNKVENFSLIRMALPTKDGVLVMGVDLQALRTLLTTYTMTESNSNIVQQNKEFKFAYFFDFNGWILFEMPTQDQSDKLSNNVDVSRRGFTGDLGRAGLDSVFRPWAVHENFWFMVKSIQSNISGSLSTSAQHYSQKHANSSAVLCFTPVTFSPYEDVNPIVVGGIAFLATSAVPQAAFSKLIWGALALLCLLGIYSIVFSYQMQKKFGAPLYLLAKEIKSMLTFNDFSAIEHRPEFQEHQMLLVASNGLIAQSMSMQNALARVEGEVYYARARQPVDLDQVVPVPTKTIFAESGIVGSSVSINGIREQIQKAARAGTDVLVWGETGTGKELVAEAIHKGSVRSSGPLVSINCGALDESLLLDVLFGHTKGAFTDAKTDRKGAFLTADGGTLHLDEIGTASLKVQQSLLRALSIRRITPLGTDVEIPFDTRVIAATNLDLRESVKNGTFREDLYYRLAIISIKTPALRERKEDIPELAAYCIQESAHKIGKSNIRLSRGALDALLDYHWPGNVREFKNCMTRAIAFAESDIILPQHIIHTEKELEDGRKTHSFKEYAPENTTETLREKFADSLSDNTSSEKNTGQLVNIPNGLNQRQAKAWPLIIKQKYITRAEYQSVVGEDISSRTAQHELREMVKLGLLERTGAGPRTYYSLRKG